MALQGETELRRRLAAIGRSFKPIAQKWADDDVRLNASHVPIDTGKLKASFRVTSVTTRRAIVKGRYTAYFVDAGPKPHVIKPKRKRGRGAVLAFNFGGRTVFARSVHHRGYRGRPFRVRMAQESLRRNPMAETVIEMWNKAA